jgi:site-specific DNA-methyltransferase (adenine-specific)
MQEVAFLAQSAEARGVPPSLAGAFWSLPPRPAFATGAGVLFSGDCLAVLPHVAGGSVDTVFADPPFNIGKDYGEGCDDGRDDGDYVGWCGSWLDECIRVLKPGGALFVYNLPRWNILLGAHCMGRGMEFRHDIAVEMKNCFPIPGRLYPSHYSLLYLTKGRPATFRKIRTPLRACRHCGGEVADYGGHRAKMNPLGANLTDVWTDVPVVRHRRYKPSGRGSNTLSTKLLDRVVEMSTLPGELVLDPFGGAGTTFAVAEAKGRRWIGVELNDAAVIAARLSDCSTAHHPNDDIVEG